ncbi:DNA base-flipping protein [Maricurvus nonylphenolicus]|uniref:MGMT family protein n=1 Tax=Maricurvus nonylphenolicus TaxID=1008307 RepID=UPI0036F1E8ED
MSQNPEMREAILLVINAIPKGRVAAYGQIAEMAGFPGRARLVGYILRNLPSDSNLPWHRVLNSQGKLSLDGPSGQEQQRRLENDGVSLYKGKVAKAYFWQP